MVKPNSQRDLSPANGIPETNMSTASKSNAVISSNSDKKTSTGTPLRRGRGTATRSGVGKQRYRQIAQNGQLPNDTENRRAAIRSRVREGLYKKTRASLSNRIEVCVPPGFLSLLSTVLETGNRAPSERDNQSESINQSSQRSQSSSTANASSASAVPLVGLKGIPVMPNSLSAIGPMGILGAGRVDPFANYPIRMNRAEEWLIDQMNTGQDPALQTLRDCWFPVAIRYPASFHQFLANLALNISRAHGEANQNVVSVIHHSQAIRLVNNSLLDPTLGMDDEIVAAVITFISYSILTGDFESWRVHMEGLEKIVRLRGGYQTLENDTMLRRLIFCVDVSGASRQDLKPRFPYSSKLLQDLRKSFNKTEPSTLPTLSLLPWEEVFDQSPILTVIFEDLRKAIEHAISAGAQNHVWRQVNFVIYWIDPVLHRLLSLEPNVNRDDSSSIIQEACRLGLILFLGEVRRKCGVMCVSTKVYVSKLKALLSDTDEHVDWIPFYQLRLWLLFFGLLESWQQPEANWYAESVSIVVKELKLSSWESVIAAVKRFLWFEDISDFEIEKFRGDIMFRLFGLGLGIDVWRSSIGGSYPFTSI